MTLAADPSIRLTSFARGGGCACKVPPGELEQVVAGLGALDMASGSAADAPELLRGLDGGDDAAAVRLDGDVAILATADFFTPVVDDGGEEVRGGEEDRKSTR